jgi:hypothetical protein
MLSTLFTLLGIYLALTFTVTTYFAWVVWRQARDDHRFLEQVQAQLIARRSELTIYEINQILAWITQESRQNHSS